MSSGEGLGTCSGGVYKIGELRSSDVRVSRETISRGKTLPTWELSTGVVYIRRARLAFNHVGVELTANITETQEYRAVGLLESTNGKVQASNLLDTSALIATQLN